MSPSYDSIKMNVLFCSLFIFLNSVAVISGKEHVPVLLWSPALDVPAVPGLRQIGAAHFSQLLHGVTERDLPMVAVFVEDALSVEDFSQRAGDGKPLFPALTEKVKEGNVEFLPSVVNPMKAIRLLKDNGYAWERYTGKVPRDLVEPTALIINLVDEPSQSRQDNIRAHDKVIAEVYGKMRKTYPNLLAIYTGRKTSWVEPERETNRVRREAGDGTDEGDATQYEGVVMRAGSFVAIATNISFYDSETGDPIVYSDLSSVELKNKTAVDETPIMSLEVTFAKGGLIAFNFVADPDAWQWNIKSIAQGPEDSAKILLPLQPVGAPRGWSYYCNLNTRFTLEGKTDKYPVIVVEGLQVQPFLSEERFEFGQPIDCVPYFSIAIWSGIMIITMLLVIMLWGILMLMDINTNDRFDDPKGKTITISATD